MAGELIPSGDYSATNEINSNGTIDNGSIVLYEAGVCIELLPGFEVITGADFHARINACVAP